MVVQKITVRPLTLLERLGDILMTPLMYVINGTFRETPQRTHRWNNVRNIPAADIAHFDRNSMIHSPGNPQARLLRHRLLIHITILGSWRDYIVLKPIPGIHSDQPWFIGWIHGDYFGYSRIPLYQPVRILVGSDPVTFFGITSLGDQISLQKIGEGEIGKGGPFACLPLL